MSVAVKRDPKAKPCELFERDYGIHWSVPPIYCVYCKHYRLLKCLKGVKEGGG